MYIYVNIIHIQNDETLSTYCINWYGKGIKSKLESEYA